MKTLFFCVSMLFFIKVGHSQDCTVCNDPNWVADICIVGQSEFLSTDYKELNIVLNDFLINSDITFVDSSIRVKTGINFT